MKKKKLKIRYFIVLISIFLLSGCWNYRELNNMSIAGSIGIDYDSENNLYDVSVQVFKAKKSGSDTSGSSGDTSPVVLYSEKGKTVHEALRNAVKEIPKKLYIGHLDLIVFGSELAKKHFFQGLDFLFRDVESRKDFNIVLAKDETAKDVLKVLTPLETNPSRSMMQTLVANSTNKGTTPAVSFDEALSYMYNDGVELSLPTVEIVGPKKKSDETDSISKIDPETALVFNSVAVFKKNKLIGYLNEDDSLGFSIITGKVGSSVISFPCDSNGNYASLEIIKMKSGAKVVHEENQIKSTISIDTRASLSEINCPIDLTDSKEYSKVEAMANKRIEQIVEHSLNTIQKDLKSDVFGFGDQLFRTDYSYWKQIKGDWEELFPEVETSIKSKVSLFTKGSIATSTTKGG